MCLLLLFGDGGLLEIAGDLVDGAVGLGGFESSNLLLGLLDVLVKHVSLLSYIQV